MSEALILESVNPQYDDILFFDLQLLTQKNTNSEHIVYKNCFECQNKNKKQFKNECFWKKFTCTSDFHTFLQAWSSSRCNLTHRCLHFLVLFCPRTSYLSPNWILFFLVLGYKFSSQVPPWRGVNLSFIQIFANLLDLTYSNPNWLAKKYHFSNIMKINLFSALLNELYICLFL